MLLCVRFPAWNQLVSCKWILVYSGSSLLLQSVCIGLPCRAGIGIAIVQMM